MIKLFDIDERNFFDVRALSVSEEQKRFLDSAVGIIARGYLYRSCRGKALGISDDDCIVGVALVRDLDEEPACYDLQQILIDKRFQNRGYGTEAVRLILSLLSGERKYDRVDVCVDKANTAALKMFGKLGFEDTGYIADCCPECLNLVCFLDKASRG